MKSKKTASLPIESLPDDEELPEGWKSITLEDYIYIAARIGWRGLKREEYTKTGPLFLAVKDIQESGAIDFQNVTDHLSEFRYDESTEIQLKNQDIIITKDGTIGKIGFVENLPGKVTVNSSLLVVRPSPEILPRFLFFYFRSPSFQSIVHDRITGSAVPHLFQKDIKKFRILVPPLAEQQRIVARVEALLTHVNAARERLSRVPLIMKRFRQVVLAAACSGKLTEGWGHEVEWDTVNFRSVTINSKDGIKTGPFGSMLKKFEHTTEGIPVYGVENVKNLQFLPKNKIFITEEKAAQISNYDVKPGDILLTRSGTVGELCVVPRGITESRISCNLMRIRVDLKKINPHFCCFLLFGSPFVLKQISDSCGGSTRIFIDGKILRTLEIPLPPLAEQHEIVRRVGLLFERADAFDQEVAAASRRCERLTQAVLGKAFRGELVGRDNAKL